MENEIDPNDVVEKRKWHNISDDAYGISCLSISIDQQQMKFKRILWYLVSLYFQQQQIEGTNL